MNHEDNPEYRDQLLVRNKEAMVSYAPIFTEIAQSGLSIDDLNKQLVEPNIRNQAVIAVNGDHYLVRVASTDRRTPMQKDTITIERLAHIPKGGEIHSGIERYEFDTGLSTRVITRHRAVRFEGEQPSFLSDAIDNPAETLEVFSKFATLRDDGTVEPHYTVVDPKKAAKALDKHTKFLEKEFGFGVKKESLAKRTEGMGKSAVRGFESDGGLKRWQ